MNEEKFVCRLCKQELIGIERITDSHDNIWGYGFCKNCNKVEFSMPIKNDKLESEKVGMCPKDECVEYKRNCFDDSYDGYGVCCIRHPKLRDMFSGSGIAPPGEYISGCKYEAYMKEFLGLE